MRPGRRHSSRSIPRKPIVFGFRARTSGLDFWKSQPDGHQSSRSIPRKPNKFGFRARTSGRKKWESRPGRRDNTTRSFGSSQIFVKNSLFDKKVTRRGRGMPRRVPIFSSRFIKKTIYRSFSLDLPGDREFPRFSTQSVQLHSEGCESPHDLRPPHILRPTSSEYPAQCPPRCLVH